MSASIVITNYNYGRYVGQAIESALAQTWRGVHVVVIDDGSTDDSWEEICRFGSHIEALRIANSGQGGATNAGLTLARDEFVLFLDADDLLDRRCVATCLALFTPGVAKVQFALRRIGADDRPLGGTIPYLMHEGDVRPIIRVFGHYAGPPCSGNFYRRSAIERYFPLAPALWRSATDTVPFLLAPFNGTVVNAPEPLGSYRLHLVNAAAGVLGNIGRTLAQELRAEQTRRDQALALLARYDGITVNGPFLTLPWSVRTRALSWKLERAGHPYPGDDAVSLLRLQAASMRAWPGYRLWERWAALLWIAAATLLPRRLVAHLAGTNTSGPLRAAFKRLCGRAA
jgi:glycosyltransferase involved in cell wall biosynthesis